MRRILNRRPSASMVVAFGALFVALSAGALANLPGTGTVNSGDIKNRTIKSKDVKKNGLGGAVIKESKLGQVPSAATATTATTATTAGSAGTAATVSNGAITSTKLGGLIVRKTTLSVVDPGAGGGAFATNVVCAAGERLIGGGVRWTGAINKELNVQSTGPSNTPATATAPDNPLEGGVYNAWRGAGNNDTGATRTVVIYATCLK